MFQRPQYPFRHVIRVDICYSSGVKVKIILIQLQSWNWSCSMYWGNLQTILWSIQTGESTINARNSVCGLETEEISDIPKWLGARAHAWESSVVYVLHQTSMSTNVWWASDINYCDYPNPKSRLFEFWDFWFEAFIKGSIDLIMVWSLCSKTENHFQEHFDYFNSFKRKQHEIF